MHDNGPMLPPRLVFSDMDWTFLAEDKSVPAGNAEALDLLAQRSIGFVPCTGRAWAVVPRELVSHPCVRYAIVSNGAMVMDVRSGKAIRSQLVGEERARALFGRVRDVDCTFDLFPGGGSRSNRERFLQILDFDVDKPNLEWLLQSRALFDESTEEIMAAHPLIEKVTMYFRGPEERSAIIAAVEEDPSLVWTTSHPKNIEVMDRDATKGVALAWLCAHEGVDVAASVAFGDSLNDLSMILAAGDGVAMCNAEPEVRAAADHVTRLDNSHAGVGDYLRLLLS
ncbi:HAD family hydrolase [Olsenella urininfantis]|uniref:HAD family hydrolase n=1 Tax=Olsenella urininfantis TaxID=1871033 RepID=UPI000984710E|nr:HAD-IIB family hydrolase [Olsenella urininfantis]